MNAFRLNGSHNAQHGFRGNRCVADTDRKRDTEYIKCPKCEREWATAKRAESCCKYKRYAEVENG